LRTGQEFRGYEILNPVGHGGLGTVYRARDTQGQVALKILPKEFLRTPGSRERFRREFELLASLSHPHIVRCHDAGEEGEIGYLVLEYVDGVSLRERLKNGPLPFRQCLSIARQICDALAYTHERGVVHRDVKPENLLLQGEQFVKIADFGLTKLVAPACGSSLLTSTGSVLGTVAYMAPEQFDDAREVDSRVDLYSTGVVLYETATGQLPHGAPACPREFDSVFRRALAKNPSDRYSSAVEFAADLDRILL